MGPIAWIKNNLIIILLVICGVQFVFGGVGTLWYRHLYHSAQADVKVAESNFALCKAGNEALSKSIERVNEATLANKKASDDLAASAQALTASAEIIAKGPQSVAQMLHNFKPTAAAKTPCDAEHQGIDAFFKAKEPK